MTLAKCSALGRAAPNGRDPRKSLKKGRGYGPG